MPLDRLDAGEFTAGIALSWEYGDARDAHGHAPAPPLPARAMPSGPKFAGPGVPAPSPAFDLVQVARDAATAVDLANRKYLAPALAFRGLEALQDVVVGTVAGVTIGMMLMASATYYSVSLQATAMILRWFGVLSISAFGASQSVAIRTAFDPFLDAILLARGDPDRIDLAARQYADAVALVCGTTAELLFFAATARGIDPVLRQLADSRLARTLGVERLRAWLAAGIRRRRAADRASRTATNEHPPLPAESLRIDIQPAPVDVGGAPMPRGTIPPQVVVEPAVALTPGNVEGVITHIGRRQHLGAKAIRLIRQAARTVGEKWNLPDMLRGLVSHALSGENLPPGFRVIDKVVLDARGDVTTIVSFKSHQPYAKGFRKAGALLEQLKTEIDALAKFGGDFHRRVRVKPTPETVRTLDVEVPPDTIEPEVAGRPPGDPALRRQMRAEAAAAVQYAKTRGVELHFKAAR